MIAPFRRALRQELKTWVTEGLVGEEQARKISERYALDRIEAEAQGTLLNTIFLIGAVLIGCGVVAFGAAHWDEIGRFSRVTLLLAAMLAAQIGGYYLWRVKGSRPHLGHSLTVLGTLIFGANIGLFAQIFHISGNVSAAYLAWGAGAAIMAYVLGSVPNAVVAVAAFFVGFCCFIDETVTAFLLWPLIAAALLLPFCYWRRSPLLFFFTILSLASALIINGLMLCGDAEGRAAIPFIVTLTALWCYGRFHHREGKRSEFGWVACGLGALGFCGALFIFSFHDVAGEIAWASEGSDQVDTGFAWAIAVPLGAVALLALVTALSNPGWLKAWAVPVCAGGAAFGALFLPEPELWGTVAFNAIALALAGYGVVAGLKAFERLPYWSGLGFVVLLIAGRFFEYDSHLLVKAAGFVGAGILLIVAGIVFENRKRARRTGAGEEAAHG